jgi:threonine dehydratase
MLTRGEIENARAVLRGVVYETPCARSVALSELTGCEVYLKLENLQMTGSFKDRGASYRVACLNEADRARGVIAASAGNHAQGLAYAGGRAGVRTCIVMPVTTPLIKVEATRRHGAEVILHGQSYDDAFEHARALSDERQLCYVHAFDDPQVIAGQGSVGLELLEQVPELDAVVVPVGGGGLIGGIGLAIKEQRPGVRVIGVEAALMPSMRDALAWGKPMRVARQRTMADGIAVRMVSELTLGLVQRYVDDLVVVDEEELAEAVLMLLEREKTLAEGAGAAPLAALLHRELGLAGKRVALLVSGGNIDVNLLARIIERGLQKSGRSVTLQVQLADQPGALAALLQIVSRLRANVLQVQHDRLHTDLASTLVELTLETRGFDHIREVEAAIRDAGYSLFAP